MQLIVFVVVLITSVLFLFVLDTTREIYEEKRDEYNYDRENPNAVVQGVNIAGTVYASDPDNTPGLGWIL